MNKLTRQRQYYKPFDFPWAYEAFSVSEQMHWLAREVPLNEDVKDWKRELNDGEREFLTQVFRFFTQADIDISSGYIDKFMPVFRPPELRMMMSSFAAREAVHIQAYSMLIDELGMPESEYSAFLDYTEMSDKHDYLFSSELVNDFRERYGDHMVTALELAKFAAFGEGLQLFASFVMLLNFSRRGLMKGMGQIVTWSIRDETHHVESMIRLYHEYIAPFSSEEKLALDTAIIKTCQNMVDLEDDFIDLAYQNCPDGIQGLSAEGVHKYIRYIADVRLNQLGIEDIYSVDSVSNPLPWVDMIVFGKEHTNFFEGRATDYSKGALSGSWDDAF